MKLPKDTENWTLAHFERALERAKRAFDEYERRVDFEAPRAKQDDLYRPYAVARQLAVDVACGVGIRSAIAQAEALP